jgi:hypothetical protein
MCPVCIANAALLTGTIFTTGGLTALAASLFRLRIRAKRISSNQPKPKEK